MSRPAKYSPDDILDAARDLFLEGGQDALKMSRIAAQLSAPSGSIYHRFPTRAHLASALWARTTQAFQETLLEALATGTAPEAVGVALAWCAAHPGEAQLLLAGKEALGAAQWPEVLIAAQRERDQQVGEALQGLAKRLDLPIRRVRYATVEQILAAVRRDLSEPDPAWAMLAVEAAEALLTGPGGGLGEKA